MEIKPIPRIPPNVIRTIPPPVVRDTPPPVIRGIQPPVINIPEPVIEYPVIDVPTREEWEGVVTPPKPEPPPVEEESRDLPASPPVKPIQEQPPPTVNINGNEIPLPEVAPLVTAGATAVVAATVTMTATIVLNQLKDKLIGPILERITKRKKIKIKQVKPVIHLSKLNDEILVYKYSANDVLVVDKTQTPEQYLRDAIDVDSLYEFDNKLVIDENIKDMFTKEGQKRFKKHFCPSKLFVKKLSARFSI